EAPCPYFGRCGGCRLQHVAYPAQLAFKSKQVADVLERLGDLSGFELRPIIGAPEIYGYRNKMEFTVTRTPRAGRLAGEGRDPHPVAAGEGQGRGQVVVGLHEADRYDSVLDVERCLLQSNEM
ncbi:MAG: RNA methyltransferase, partial [Candidatus Rokuibacteriota bacterium]